VGRVEELGIEVLRNEHRVLEARGERFVLAGVDDYRSRQMPGEGGEDLGAALAGVPEDLPVVLMAHDPTTFHRACERGVDLQLSGHTHGGQIWPFNYFVRVAMPWVAGLYRRGRAQVYVSRGTGFWGPPMRLGAPAEITEIVLRSGRD
jgi:predicted MPP superfamily phosphohydrolase